MHILIKLIEIATAQGGMNRGGELEPFHAGISNLPTRRVKLSLQTDGDSHGIVDELE